MNAAPNTEEREHARRSSSSLGGMAICCGYESRKTKKTHWVTKQGLRGHAALEKDNDEVLDSDFEQKMVDLCREYEDKLPAGEVLKEIRIETIEGRWGFADRFVRHSPTEASLVDYKFVKAKEVVDAEINLQGKDYVVGLFAQYPELEVIHVHFPMPRFQTVTTATFTRAQVPELKLEIFAVLRRAKRTDSNFYRGKDLTPHYDTCRFCKHSGDCVALRKIADDIGRKYDPTGYGMLPPVPEETHASKIRDPKTLSQLKMLSGVMKEWAASVDYNVTDRAVMDGVVPDGYVLDERTGRRRITNAIVLLAVAPKYGLTVDDLVECADVKFTALEERIKASAPKGKKTKAVEAFMLELIEHGALERDPSTPILTKSHGQNHDQTGV